MTLGSGLQAESAMAAFTKRKAQLERWRESDTHKESSEIRNRPKRIKFADRCIFLAACASNDNIQVERMIKDGYDINAVDDDGITALHQACIEDNFETVEFLLVNGADVNISDNEGWTPLHAVATCCYVSIAKLLLEFGANVVALNNDCNIPIDICKSDEIKDLLKQDISRKGIDLGEARKGEELKMMEDAKKWVLNGYYEEEPHPTTGATAMHVAACKGYIKVLDLLIIAGADINGRDFDGWTPLHAAAHWGQEEACRVLLENACDMTIKNNCEQTAFDVADDGVQLVLDQFKRKPDVVKHTNILPLPPKKKNSCIETEESVTISLGPKRTIDGPNNNGSEEEVEANEAADTVSELPSSADSVDPNSLVIPSTSNIISTNVSEDDRNRETRNENEDSTKSESNGDSGFVDQLIIPRTLVSSEVPKLSKVSEKEKESSTVPGLVTSSGTAAPSSPVVSGGLRVNTTSVTRPAEGGGGDDNTPAWRRSGSLRTRTTGAPLEDKSNDRVTVRRTRSEASTDVNLRRAYSFESDSKFYSRLTSARNRIKAIEAASAAMTANSLDVANLSTTNMNSTPSLALPSTESTLTTPVPLHNQNNAHSLPVNNFEGVLRRKDQDFVQVARPTTISTISPQNRVAGINNVQMRSGDNGSVSSSPSTTPTTPVGTKISPVSKFKQFLIKSFVPPTRDEESETQRKAHAKRVRETRRSTQGVTLEELKSAEQYVKSQQGTTLDVNDQSSAPVNPTVPVAVASSTVLRKEEESLERRPSWRLRVDDSDRSKFSLEDTRSVKGAGTGGATETAAVAQRVPLNQRKSSRNESSQGKPPRPPDDGSERLKNVLTLEEDKDLKNVNTGAQAVILRKKRTKRRSTGVVQYNTDGSEHQDNPSSDSEVCSGRSSGASSDVEPSGTDSRSENGLVTRVNYKKLYEETIKENQLLKMRLTSLEEKMTDLKLKVDRNSSTPRISPDESNAREKRALEGKLSEMEEELKLMQKLKLENEKLKAENRALTRVVSRLSGAAGIAAAPTMNFPGPKGPTTPKSRAI